MRRAYDLLRAYVGREWERIESVFEQDARRELDEYLKSPAPPAKGKAAGAPKHERTGPMDVQTAYKVLNLQPDATLRDLRRAYKRLSERSLPTNFPEGSEERRKAAHVHLKVQEAYEILLPLLDPRLRRFQSLDVD